MADERVVTELVIDADTSGADKYSQAMDRAGNSSKSFSESQSSIGLAVAGVSASLVAAFAAINSGLDYIAKLNKGLADMATQAKNTGLGLADIQGLKFGGAVTGLSDSQINSGLERSAQLLNDASRNSNSLSKELASNGISVREANGQLISQNKLLGIAADLLSRARNPGDQAAIAQMLGFTKEWIPLLEQGPVAMSGLTDEARKAGAVLDDEVIQRAVQFDKEWRKSSVEMEYYLKSALLSLLPYVDDLIDRLTGFVKSIDVAKIAAGAEDHAKDVFGPGEAALKEAGVGGLEIGISPEFKQAINEFQNTPVLSLDFWAAAGRVFSNSVTIVSEQDVKWSAGAEPIRDTSSATIGAALRAKAETDTWTAAGKSWKDYSSAVTSGAATISAGYSNVASRTKDTADAYDRAVESITKHTARTEADLIAVGKGAGAQEELRASYQLATAAQLAGIPITQKMKDQIQDLAQDAGEAAAELKLARAQADANFVSQTQLLSVGDKAAAGVMYNLYGDQWQSHMDDALAKQVKMNSLLQQVNGLAGTAFSGIAKDLANGVAPAQAIAKATKAAAESVLDIAAKQIVGNLLGDIVGSTAGQTVGATTSATILTTAGATVAASIIAGATEAAAILGLTVPAAATSLPIAGAVTGTEVAAGGVVAGAALATGGTVAGAAIWGPIALLAAAVAAIGALSIFGGGDDKKKQEAARVQALNNRATLAGLDQSTLEGQLTAFDLNANVERTALPNGGKTEKSLTNTLSFGLFGDGGGETTEEAVALEKALAAERLKVIDDFNKKAIETEKQRVEAATKMMNDAVAMLDNVTMSDTAERLKDIQTASGDLSTALVELGQSTDLVADKVAAAMANLRKTFSEGLSTRLNSANGMGYLNDAAELIKQYQQDSADAASIGIGQMQVAAVFRAEAQNIVDDAGLIGDSFGDFLQLFPQFAGVVGQSATALKAASDKIQSFVKSINEYLNGLKVGANSILSPQDQLAAAQSNFSAQLALARSGNEDALGSITGVATTLLDQAKSFYATSAGYTDIYNQVTSALQALTNIGSTTGISADAVAIVKAVNTTGAQADALAAAQNALSLSQVDYLQAQQTLLAAIRDLSGATRDQVSLLKDQLTNNAQSATITAYYGRDDHSYQMTTSNNNLLTALNKIVVNTFATALNTYALVQDSGAKEMSHSVGALASGGWITGGTPGKDSVLLGSRTTIGMPDEFVVRRDVAQANRSWLPEFNATGMLPPVAVQMPMVSAVYGGATSRSAGNDNGQYFSELGNTLVRAITGAMMAEITSNKEEMAALRAEIVMLRRAVEGNKPKTPQAGTRMAS